MFFIAALGLVSMTVSAQSTSVKESLENVSFGVRLGGNLSSTAGNECTASYHKGSTTYSFDAKNMVGFQVGVIADLPFPNVANLYIQPGVYYTTKGAKSEGNVSNKVWNIEASANYIEVPILASYRLPVGKDMNVHFNAGPYVAFGVGGKLTQKATEHVISWLLIEKEDGDYDFEDIKPGHHDGGLKTFGDKGVLNRLDFGLNLGAGFNYGPFYAGAGYEFSLVNVGKTIELGEYKQEFNLKNSNIFLHLGYNFSL